MTSVDLASIGTHDFVALTTFRRDGTPVATPMWVAYDAGRLVFTTPSDTGKVRRVRDDSRVRIRPCTRMGRVDAGAPTVDGVAEIVTEDGSAETALRAKYGWQYRVVLGIERLVARRTRDRVVLRVGWQPESS